jgi:uncharacterized membrane protein
MNARELDAAHTPPQSVSARVLGFTPSSAWALNAAATCWFVVAVLGQWIFVVYIVAYYGGALVAGDYDKWGRFLTHGLMSGDHLGNAALATHLATAAIITGLGPLQLVPQLRSQLPRLHRLSGRVYLLTVVLVSSSALYLVWVRNERVAGDLLQHLGISLDASLILICGALALRAALARRFALHRRWAVRLYLVVSGVWFFRVGLMFWLVVNRGPVGFDPKTFQGPFLDCLSFAESLLPLAVFELYWRARDHGGVAARATAAAVVCGFTAAMGTGIFAAFMGLWLPNI